MSRFAAHGARITDIQAGSSSQPHLLASCAADGTASLWDLRTSSTVLTVQRPGGGGTVHSVALGCDDTLMATGSKDGAHFYDIRGGGTLLGEYVESHSDDVLCVRFHPNKPTILMTGGADGLACVFNVAVNGEDEALMTVCNAQSDVIDVKSLDGDDVLCCQTSVETLCLFRISDGQCVANWNNFRAAISQSCGCDHVDYVVNTYYDYAQSQMHALVGTFAGDLLDVGLNGDGTIVPCGRMSGGHYRPVRCGLRIGGMIVTGGEDTRLCAWSVSGESGRSGVTVGSGVSGVSGGGGGSGGSAGKRVGKQKRAKKKTYSPY